jgi:hypothetical protein
MSFAVSMETLASVVARFGFFPSSGQTLVRDESVADSQGASDTQHPLTKGQSRLCTT